MTDQAALGRRLNDLEATIAHQDQKLDEMSDTIAEQWAKIDALTRQTERLNERVRSLEGDLQSLQPGDQPPPHY